MSTDICKNPLKSYDFDMDTEETYLIDDFIDDLRNDMYEMNPGGSWHAEGSNMGWRKLSGHKDFSTTDSEELIHYIAPKTQSYNGKCEVYENRIEFTIYHHDAPTGESYIVTPVED